MQETVDWLRERPYYEGQVCDHRVLAGQAAMFRDLDLEPRLDGALESAGVTDPYAHQARAVEAVRDGRNVVLATPTASGKSLAYTVPAFERAMDRGATTLYLAPQVALLDDQAATLSGLARDLGFGSKVDVAQYTGRQSRTEKESIRDRRPTVLLVTPDMLHYALLPHARRLWEWFFPRLETVVIDEVHEYRGVFGSHVALVFRRLARLCEEFGADPDWVCCSATIGNPVEHAASVTGQPRSSFDLVDEDESATGPRHWVLWNPPEYDGGGWGRGRADGDATGGERRRSRGERTSASSTFGRRRSSHTETKRLFVDLVSRGYQTLAFTRSRQTAERYASESADSLRERGEGDLAVGAYQAALTDERRRDLETRLHDGDLRGVWSTSALELGVDVGGLDAVLLDGYPGTRMSTFQRAGRAGRGTDPALVVLVGGEDQLDRYFLSNPDDLFDGDPERAVANPANGRLAPGHVRSAARESWLAPDDDRHFGPSFPDWVADLTDEGLLERRETAEGVRWLDAAEGSPQQETSLRTIDDRQIRLRDRRRDEVIARLPFADGLRDAHPGAVYHHQGRTYEVTELDTDLGVAELEPTWADYFTRVRHDKAMTVEADLSERHPLAREDVPVRFADVTMRKQITGFERRDAKTGEPLGTESLSLPETSLRTRALYFTVPDDVEARLRDLGDFAGGIHAAEHAAIAMFPTTVLCDRRDVGGLSTPLHHHTGQSTVFVYDGHPGGVGLARTGYEGIATLLRTTRELLADCPCESGCPACVQSPHCGNANDPLDKQVARELLSVFTR